MRNDIVDGGVSALRIQRILCQSLQNAKLEELSFITPLDILKNQLILPLGDFA
ncbi:MAG: hypothetical protein RIC19_05675 [Phaeodactylibacter sp.]|uniref:hypothetical protein n=1 Tax=Phaeodactylibacter sp. TaxID=1940289 RepID=UPI0032ED5720